MVRRRTNPASPNINGIRITPQPKILFKMFWMIRLTEAAWAKKETKVSPADKRSSAASRDRTVSLSKCRASRLFFLLLPIAP